MLEYIRDFLNMGFIPHGHCYLWRPELVYLNVIGDTAIGLSYYSIPITLIDFVRRRKDLPFNWIFVLFSGFILSCGSGHLADIWTLWYPDYWLSTGIKVITAIVSLITAIALVSQIPKAMALLSPSQLREANIKLEAEILERQKAQESLEKSERLLAAYNLDLEHQIKARTTELEIAKQTAESAHKAKSDFLTNISHELRTPLNAVIGFTELMHTDSSNTPQQKEILSIVSSSGQHLMSLINNVLNISRIEAGADYSEISVVDIRELLLTVRSMLLLTAKHKNINLHFDYSADLPELIETDRMKLKQILINLISNALKFTTSGYVVISASLSPIPQIATATSQSLSHSIHRSQLVFTVKDTGIGIAATEIPHLFTSYNSSSRRSPDDSSGLGLYLSKKLIKSLGGNIEVSSELGIGTTFKFDIPIVNASTIAPSSSELSSELLVTLAANQPERAILVVDNEYTNRKLLTKVLSRLGLVVQEASNGMEALDLWNAKYYDLIYMDLQMPNTDGYEATRLIRSSDRPQPKIIAVTANIFVEPKSIFEIGCNDILYKPFKQTEILEMLAKHLEIKLVYNTINSCTINNQSNNQLNNQLVLSAESMQFLPLKSVANLQDAIYSADLDRLKVAIAQIRNQNIELADIIEAYTKQYAYEPILQVITEYYKDEYPRSEYHKST